MKNSKKSPLKSLGFGVSILLGLLVYAYGFNVIDVNFAETRKETRITSLHRILRALAHPHIFDYEKEELIVEVPFYLPCPEGGAEIPGPKSDEPYLVMVGCGEAKDIFDIEGYNFWPNTKGPINFIAASPSEGTVSLTIGNITTDADGYFKGKVQLPTRLPVEDAQAMEVKVRRNVGAPYFSSMAITSGEAIVETIFTALLATTFGLILAIPISFMAAKNLMVTVRASVTSTSLAILGWPLGIVGGIQVTKWVQTMGLPLVDNGFTLTVVLILIPIAGFFMLRWALPQKEIEAPNTGLKTARLAVIVLNVVLGILFLSLLASLAFKTGTYIIDNNESWQFLGGFIFQLGDILQILLQTIVALIGGATIGNLGQRFGQQIADRMSSGVVRIVNLVTASLAFATLFSLVGAGVEWFYQFGDPIKTLYWPAGVGVGLGIILALTFSPKQTLPTGLFIYTITRGLLNLTRSVEPLIMVIVFVVWVGIGPFAGSLALALHTIAALAKLFSEQVESILPGPMEAIQATGANKLQTIVYAVVPQIIPPYISFTMYRWDINVRMSTIIGFGGGGGIGFLLQQNIGLFNYRDASVQMFAIAITVASMDYLSSVLRERAV